MNPTTMPPKLAQALHKAQSSITAAALDSTNPQFKSKYASISSVIEAIKGPLTANDLFVLQPLIDPIKEGYIRIDTVICHISGESVSYPIELKVDAPGLQKAGGAITYVRRYALTSLFLLPTEDDDGNEASRKVEYKTPQPTTAKPKQPEPTKPLTNLQYIENAALTNGWSIEELNQLTRKMFGDANIDLLLRSEQVAIYEIVSKKKPIEAL